MKKKEDSEWRRKTASGEDMDEGEDDHYEDSDEYRNNGGEDDHYEDSDEDMDNEGEDDHYEC